MIAPNTIVGGRYRVMRPLGGGGMKLVYLAEDLRLASRECALAEMVDTFTSPANNKSPPDLSARGATMHHALSSRDPALEPPFSFPPLRSLCPDITPALCELVDQALKYDVVLRVAGAAEFRPRLIAIKSGAPIT